MYKWRFLKNNIYFLKGRYRDHTTVSPDNTEHVLNIKDCIYFDILLALEKCIRCGIASVKKIRGNTIF